MSKMREDEIERRIENRAAILDEYQPFFKQCFSPKTPFQSRHDDLPSHTGTTRQTNSPEEFEARLFVSKFRQSLNRIGPELLAETSKWTLSHFNELAKISPEVIARLTMAYRTNCGRNKEREPSFRAFLTMPS